MARHELIVGTDATRLDIYLALNIAILSRSAAHKLILEGGVRVNGMSAKPSHKLKTGDLISVDIAEPVPVLSTPPQNIKLDILYEDRDIVVVNKPRGMVVHPAAGHYENTLVNALLYHCAGKLSGINGVMRPGIVHRIDKDTSGILVAAKNDFSHRALALQLAAHDMTRVYTAIAHGLIKSEAGIINKPIARHPSERKKMAVISTGKSAITHFRVLTLYKKHTLLEARLETGRTHQIRVHMASIGHPLLGDHVYGRADGVNGQALHAGTLGFVHPTTAKYMEFSTEPPDYFKELIALYEESLR